VKDWKLIAGLLAESMRGLPGSPLIAEALAEYDRALVDDYMEETAW